MEKNRINIESTTIGADPEVFLYSKKENKHISAVGLIGGTKENPKPITSKGHFIQEDGIAAEYNIPPCDNAEDFVNNINFVKNYIEDTIAKPLGLILSKKASAIFTNKDLDCKQAQEIGCTPDLDSWNLSMNSPSGYTSNLRACGGHVHVGYNDSNEETSIELARAMDLFLGVGSVLLDKDTQRRSLYGKAGAMRFKSFGMEYRSLSNFWIFDEKLTKWVFENTILAVNFVKINGIITNPQEIQDCINNCDIELAKSILDDYNIPMPSMNSELIEEEEVNYFDTLPLHGDVEAS